MTTTPGYWYAAAYWLSCLFYIGLNRRRLNARQLSGVSTLFLGLLLVFMVATDGVAKIYFAPCMALIFVLTCLFVFVSCDMCLKKAVYFTTRAFLLGEFMASLGWQLAFYLRESIGMLITMIGEVGCMAVVYGTITAIMYFLEGKYREDNDRLQISGREMALALVIGLCTYVLSNLSYISADSPFSSRFPAEIFIIRTLTDLVGVGALFGYHMMLRELNVKMEREYLKRLLHMQHENYRIAEESIELVNQKYHDLKHQIALLRAEAGSSEKLALLDQMEQDIKAYEAQNKTGNRALDTMLTAKSLQCQREGISLTCVADGKELDFMDLMDVSALFGNALDNAIESVMKLEDRSKRLIHISVARQKGFVRIRVENCFTGELHYEDGLPATTKNNHKYHGYGVKSIRRIVEKYGGSTSISTRDGWFELRILLPAADNSKSGSEAC